MIALMVFAVPWWFPRDRLTSPPGLLHVLLQEMAPVSVPAPQTLLSIRLGGQAGREHPG